MPKFGQWVTTIRRTDTNGRSRMRPAPPCDARPAQIDPKQPREVCLRTTDCYAAKAELLGCPVTVCCQAHCCLSSSECQICASDLQISCHGMGCVDSVDQFHLVLFEPSVLEDGTASQCWIRRIVDDGQALLGPAASHVEQTAGAVRTGLSAGGFIFKVRL